MSEIELDDCISGVTHILDQVQALLRDLGLRHKDGIAKVYEHGTVEQRMRLFMALAEFAVSVEKLGESYDS